MLLTVFVCYNLINGREKKRAKNKRHSFYVLWNTNTNYSFYNCYSYYNNY